MTGALSSWLGKGKLQGKFDGIFVSSRVAQVLSDTNFRALCKNADTVIAVETAKFLVPLNKDTQHAMLTKEEELAAQNGFEKIKGLLLMFLSLVSDFVCFLNGVSFCLFSSSSPKKTR